MNPFLLGVVRNQHQVNKYQQLEELASKVTDGVIVELGTYLGYGAIALCTGASVPVYTIDDYGYRKGWAGEIYHPNDMRVAQRNFKEANVNPLLFTFDVRDFIKKTPLPVSLLFWDLGIPARLCQDFEAWERHITGKFVIHDTDDNRLGSDLLNPTGWTKKKDGVFWILQRE